MLPYLSNKLEAGRPLRPVDLGRTVGLSPSQVRTYENVGFIPAAQRSSTGYRRYTGAHVEALRVARCLIGGYGWLPAQRVLSAVHAGDTATALAAVDACHADLHRQRGQIADAMRALEQIGYAEDTGPMSTARRLVRIGAAARLAGVRPSALRFWEQQGLLQPTREPRTEARCYPREQLQRVQIITLLRAAGYRFVAIRSVLDDLAASRPEQARAALEQRRRSVERASRKAMRATSTLYEYLETLGSGEQSA
ncbi:MerR family transcriptional regulator [Actinopolymorpha rutila]